MVSPDGHSDYAVNEWDDGLAVFGRDTTTDRLTIEQMVHDGLKQMDGLSAVSALSIGKEYNKAAFLTLLHCK